MADVPIEGTCDPRFERVRKAFGQNFERNEVGAAVAVLRAFVAHSHLQNRPLQTRKENRTFARKLLV